MQGEPFDWHSRTHRTLDGQLLAALDSTHSFGICHRDLHQGNILVTSDDQIVLLDFAGANLDSTAEDRIAERKHMAMLLTPRQGMTFSNRIPSDVGRSEHGSRSSVDVTMILLGV